MEILIQDHVGSEQEILRDFLYLAIYTPDGQSPPPYRILQKPELSRYVESWGKPDDHGVFALTNSKIVAACWARCFPNSEPGYGFIQPIIPELSLAVLPEYRRKGIGTKLIQALLTNLQGKYQAVSLSVSTKNPAKNLYIRLGFKCHHQSNDHMVMIKEFLPAA